MVAPGVKTCSSTRFEVSGDDEGRSILTLGSCSNWGDVGRVYTEGPDSSGSSYGLEGYNSVVIGPGPLNPSQLSSAIGSISIKCSQLCSGCMRYKQVSSPSASNERLLAMINLSLKKPTDT